MALRPDSEIKTVPVQAVSKHERIENEMQDLRIAVRALEGLVNEINPRPQTATTDPPEVFSEPSLYDTLNSLPSRISSVSAEISRLTGMIREDLFYME